MFQPKASLILGPRAKTELYISYGRGFHSDDVRGVFGTVPEEGTSLSGGVTRLLASTTIGVEIGLPTNIVPKVSLQFAVFQQDFESELVYNPDSGQDEAGAPSRASLTCSTATMRQPTITVPAEFIDALVALTIALIGMENVAVASRRPGTVAMGVSGSLLLMTGLRLFGAGLLPPLLLGGAAIFSACYLMTSGHLRDADRIRLVVTLVFGLIHGFGFAATYSKASCRPKKARRNPGRVQFGR